MLSGVVTLKLSRTTYVRNLKVRFVGKCNLVDGDRYLETKIVDRTHEIDIFKELPAGQHSFTFDFILAQTLAVSERSTAGRVVFYVHASAPGVGRLGSECTASRRVLIISCPAQPPPFDYSTEGLNPDIGPYRINAHSELLSVGGAMRYTLHLAEPPIGLKINKTDGYFRQSTTITLPDGTQVDKPNQLRRIFLVDAVRNEIKSASSLPQRMPDIHEPRLIPLPSEPLITLTGEPWTLSHFGRIPGDDLLRPSTLPGTHTPIRVTQSLVIEVTYETVDGRERKMTVTTPVNLLSCCCRYSSVILPTYTERPRLEEKARGVMDDFAECCCGLTVTELVMEGGATALLRVPSFELYPTEPEPRTGPKATFDDVATIASTSTGSTFTSLSPGSRWAESARSLASRS